MYIHIKRQALRFVYVLTNVGYNLTKIVFIVQQIYGVLSVKLQLENL